MRVFFGFEPDSDTKRKIADWRDRYGLADGRPVPMANFHITLAFIGEIDEQRLDRLCRSIEEWGPPPRMVPGQLVLDKVGFWPRAGIYWLGTDQYPEEVARTARALQQIGTRFGARRDRRPFTPHVSLFRNCLTPPPAPAAEPDIPFGYDAVTLFESRQGASGVHYSPIAQWELQPVSPSSRSVWR